MIEIKYAASNHSHHGKESFQATPGSAGYDLFAAERKVILANSTDLISLELKLGIRKSYYRKIHPRSNLIKNYFVTVEGGVLDSNFRGVIKIIMIDCPREDFHVDLGERVAQVIFQKREEVNFVKVHSTSTQKVYFF